MIDIKLENIEVKKYELMREWCRENFGQGAWWKNQLTHPDSTITWYSNSNYTKNHGVPEETGIVHFYFKNDKDSTMFMLRWG